MAKKTDTSAAANQDQAGQRLREATAAENGQTARLLLADCHSLLSATKVYRKAIKTVLRSEAAYAPDVLLDENIDAANQAMGDLHTHLERVEGDLEEVRRRTLGIIDDLQDLRY